MPLKSLTKEFPILSFTTNLWGVMYRPCDSKMKIFEWLTNAPFSSLPSGGTSQTRRCPSLLGDCFIRLALHHPEQALVPEFDNGAVQDSPFFPVHCFNVLAYRANSRTKSRQRCSSFPSFFHILVQGLQAPFMLFTLPSTRLNREETSGSTCPRFSHNVTQFRMDLQLNSKRTRKRSFLSQHSHQHETWV